uniref:Helicase ATP-binding domain-containing protein n=1 Tax=viral metagenome TaxID=1070528 RepID=A0A6C0AXQ4_9ZZZZ|tara:strand:+ start:18862 stop:21711 length:2850 start_codon:yes stop_codon:yes gene_type:complete
MSIRNNQQSAIDAVLFNNFKSGVIAHATGTGKSIIGIKIINEYIKFNSKANIMWLCEFKIIINELFNNKLFCDNLKELNKDYNLFNYSIKKDKNWISTLNNSKKPYILFINRAYLTSQQKYKNLKNIMNLIIHDECHSIKNISTKSFYNYIKNNNCNIIGLSATPYYIYPFENLIHSYTLYDAIINKDIVNPHIFWFTKEQKLSINEIIEEIDVIVRSLYYKKIVVWCGLISECNELALLFSRHFTDFKICIDTSLNVNYHSIGTFDTFKDISSNAFLFCAAKHREGSDIKNLDGCIFMDKVSKRTPKTFIQCLGRVLRINENKQRGIIIDIKAKSAYDVIKRLGLYLNNNNKFPYSYSYYYSNNNKIKINNLLVEETIDNSIKEIINENDVSRNAIKSKFKKNVIDNDIYKKRLEMELDIFEEKNLLKYLYFAIEILELTKDIPHVTRGSCGSSLLCYYLGISHVDPVKYNIKFERFLNIYRNNLPDIDFDFPHSSRDEIFFRLEKKWPGKIARISNHVHYHEKSATRAVLKELGHNKFIGKYEINDYIKKLPKSTRDIISNRVKNIENKFRMYSLHCGGIVFYPEGVPEYLKYTAKSQNVINQITLNKYDIANEKKFKIDILSSRALTQLFEVDPELAFKDFSNIQLDNNVLKLFKMGKNIGITLAESPLIKKAMIDTNPNSISDLALVLAIIRPAAKEYSGKTEISKNDIIYDDDAVEFLSKNCNVDYSKADYYRRCIIKYDNDIIDEIKKKLSISLYSKLDGLHGYGFCKAHAYSYAELIYKLAYLKTYKPEQFWKSTLKNAESSYRSWVHLFEAKQNNVDFKYIKQLNESVYCKKKNNDIYKLNHNDHLQKYGIWNLKLNLMYPGCYGYIHNNKYFYKGIIASIKVLDKVIIYFICVGINRYIEVIINRLYINNLLFKKFGIKGHGKLENSSIICVKSIMNKYF